MCVALLLAGGAFLSLQPFHAPGATPCREIAVRYPVGDLSAAWRSVRRAAREHPGAYVVGESAGGTLALNLAARGLVRGAVVMGPPVDLVAWRGVPDVWRRVRHDPPALRRALSVRRVRRPTVLVYGEQDGLVEHRPVAGARLVLTPGGHLNRTSWPRVVRRTIRGWES